VCSEVSVLLGRQACASALLDRPAVCWSCEDLVAPEPIMTLPRSVTEVLSMHVELEVESIDRMYLNVYVPKLQRNLGVVSFFRFHRGHTFASSALMQPISDAFIKAVDPFTEQEGIPVLTFEEGQRKDDIAREHLGRFRGEEGGLFMGKAQEKTPVARAQVAQYRRQVPRISAAARP